MANYTIDDFWKTRLTGLKQVDQAPPINGWNFSCAELPSFTEAPVAQNTIEYGSEVDPRFSSLLLVSAPGAVGKSTLAKQIAAQTGAVYVDLAQADTVGAYTLTGILETAGILAWWKEGSVTTLIDGLDEARLRVTQEGFQHFLADVARLSTKRACPTVLFGRTRIIQDTWLMLHEEEATSVAVLEIGFYDLQKSIEFVESRLASSGRPRPHAKIEKEAVTILLAKLRSETASDGDRFAGYAPVLEAVAKLVEKDTNPSSLVAELQSGLRPVTLSSVVADILKREQGKLNSLSFQEPHRAVNLYDPQEQLDRLVSRIYNIPGPELPEMSAQDSETYLNALETWVGEHPFLLEGGLGTSSAVFEAVIATHALFHPSASEAAFNREINKGTAANPFLHTFYMDKIGLYGNGKIREKHIGLLYASLRSSLSIAETASLHIEGPDVDDDSSGSLEVEFIRSREGDDKPIRFVTGQDEPIVLGSYISDVRISAPQSAVEIGPGSEVTLVAPVNVDCKELLVAAEKLIVYGNQLGAPKQVNGVWLQANDLIGSDVRSVPIIRNGASLWVWWADVYNYPWTNFASPPENAEDPSLSFALRRLRRFVIEFRSSGNNRLTRSKDKLDGGRMTKEGGKAVLDQLLKEQIVQSSGWLYVLDTDRLAEVIGVTYGDCMAYRFGDKAVAFVKRALDIRN